MWSRGFDELCAFLLKTCSSKKITSRWILDTESPLSVSKFVEQLCMAFKILCAAVTRLPQRAKKN